MTHYEPFFYIARLVLETCTPLSIASGRTDGIADNLIVRDANGLPAIPGSSLAGVLRHSYQRLYDLGKKEKEAFYTNELFGSEKKTPVSTDKKTPKTNNEAETGCPSFVHVSWGCLHDKNDQPIEGLLDPDDSCWQNDKIIKDALQSIPIRREHVKLNHRGISDAKKQGKFDRISLTTGHRFSVELSLWSDEANDPRWQRLLNLIKRPEFRLGGGTRRGLGKLKIVRGYIGNFNLQETEDFNKFCNLTQCLTNTELLQPLDESESEDQHTIKLTLTPLDGYRFGGGTEHLIENGQADMLAVTENCVTWQNDQAEITKKKQIVIPASSVKGAISHRVAYHYNILTQTFADKPKKENIIPVGENNEAVKELFGYVNEDTAVAKTGNLIFDDIYLAPKDEQVTEYTHNNIDRFTGGVRDGALFSEEVITDKQTLVLNINVVNQPEGNIWKAFELALNDLTQGRLALGAASGRGHGYFTGEWQ